MQQQQLSPEDIELLRSILQGGADSGQMDSQADAMQQLIEQLRGNSKQPELMDAGAFKVAPSPMAYLGAGANSLVANQKQNQLTGLRQRQAGIRSDQNNRMMDALIKMQQQPVAPQPPQLPDPYQQFRMPGGA